MKKTKIVLFTLLLSIMGVVGSTNAASVNNSSRSADLMPSAASQLIQNSSLSETNIENSESGKCILWSPGFRTFKKGDQVKVLLQHGEYTGKTRTIKIISGGKQVGTLYLTYGDDYGIIVFTIDTNSGEIAQFIADFGNIDFGAIGNGDVINIGGGVATGGTAGVGPVAPVASSSSHINVESQSSQKLIPSESSSLVKASSSSASSSYYGNGKGIVIHFSSGVIIRPTNYSSHSSSSLSLSSSSSMNNGVHRHSKLSSVSCSSAFRSVSRSSSSKLSRLSSSSSSSSSALSSEATLKRHHSYKSIVVTVPKSVKRGSKSLKLNHSSSTLKASLKTSRHLKVGKEKADVKATPKALSRMVKTEKKQHTVRPVVDRKGNIHLSQPQVQTLKHKLHFPNSTTVAVKKAIETKSLPASQLASPTSVQNNSKPKENLEHHRNASLASNIRRVILPIKGILPATRMDPYTWVYSLIGLGIIIIWLFVKLYW